MILDNKAVLLHESTIDDVANNIAELRNYWFLLNELRSKHNPTLLLSRGLSRADHGGVSFSCSPHQSQMHKSTGDHAISPRAWDVGRL